jgi:phosphoglycolate phosphatase
MPRTNHVIWDCNGTLINDMPLSCEIMNEMLLARRLGSLSLLQYQQIYQHPMSLVYEKAGFDLARESYANLTQEWHEQYSKRLREIKLHVDALYALDRLKEREVVQVILSALPHIILVDSLRTHEVDHYFACVLGLEDNLARSKVDNGKILMEKAGADVRYTVLIGDTGHDAEAAKALGVPCYLVARGFEDKERLIQHDCGVFENFVDLLDNLGF